MEVACGSYYSLLIDHDGLVWASGANECGQLGVGTEFDQDTFCPVKAVSNAIQVSCGCYHSAILDKQGDLWMFGLNDVTQTGIKSVRGRISTPTKVIGLPCIAMVSCGVDYSVVLDCTGCIWGTGINTFGQMSSEEERLTKFTKINTSNPDIGRIIKIRCRDSNIFAQSETGELWSTGLNTHGELGLGHNQSVDRFHRVPLDYSQVQVQSFDLGYYHTILLDGKGTVWVTGLSCLSTDQIVQFTIISPSVPPMVFIACGGHSTMMVDDAGKVHVCGYNEFGQLGLGCNSENIISPQIVRDLPKIAQGYLSDYFTLLVDEEGGVWMSGNNMYGQHGRGGFIIYNRITAWRM